MAWAEYSVLTPERVKLEYDIAGIGSRGAAAIVDTAIQLVALILVVVGLSAGYTVSGALLGPFSPLGRSGGGALLLALISLGILVVTSGYFMLWEILWNGQTPGKRLVGVRVIRESGYPLRPIDAVIRNLVRIVDWLPFFYGVGMLVMLLNRRSRRLGDFASGTIVVREGSRGALSLPITSRGMPTLPSTVDARGFALSSTDATLVRDFLVRRASMHPQARAAVARRLATAMARRYGLSSGDDPEAFLQTLTA